MKRTYAAIPSEATDETWIEILDLIRSGVTVVAAHTRAGMHHDGLYSRARYDPDLKLAFDYARLDGHGIAYTIPIADPPLDDCWCGCRLKGKQR